jgi:hypothetical protein
VLIGIAYSVFKFMQTPKARWEKEVERLEKNKDDGGEFARPAIVV